MGLPHLEGRILSHLELEASLMGRGLHDLTTKEGRSRIGLESRVSDGAVAFSYVTVGTMSTHVLNVTINALGETPVC